MSMALRNLRAEFVYDSHKKGPCRLVCLEINMYPAIVATFFFVAIAAASGQLDGQGAPGGGTYTCAANFTNVGICDSTGTGNASIPAGTQTAGAFGSVAVDEGGNSTAPKAVEQALLLDVDESAMGQTAGLGGFPCSTDVGCTNPNELPVSSEAIVESDGMLFTCDVAVEVISLFSTGSMTSTLINLVFRNWAADVVAAPWTTVVNGPYTKLSNALNVIMDVPQGQTIQGSVHSSPVPANGTSSVPITLIVEAPVGTVNLVPTSILQNGQKCVLTTAGLAASPTIHPSHFGVYNQFHEGSFVASVNKPQKAISLNGSQIIGTDGKEVSLHGVNWFGFESGDSILGGLDQRGGSALQSDLATITKRILLLGFNAVRLPFSMQLLNSTAEYRYRFARGRCTPSSEHEILTSVTDSEGCSDTAPPGGHTCGYFKASGKCDESFMQNYCFNTCGRCGGGGMSTSGKYAGGMSMHLPYQPTGTPGMCNSYLPPPGCTVYEQLIATILFLTRNGIYVVLDNQLNYDTTALHSQTTWLQTWERIAHAVSADPASKNHVIYDVLNEPEQNFTWASQLANSKHGSIPAMADMYFSVFDAIHKINPDALFMIEGLGQGNYGDLNQGDGLITDRTVVEKYKLPNPIDFFTRLLKKPYRKQVIIAVHVYPPSISKGKSQYNAANGLYERLSLSHGYLNMKGYCYGDDCQVFPVVYGEMGTKFEKPEDKEWFDSIVPYMNNVGAGADGKHHAIKSWFWWAWNPNSADTGGILDANWKDIMFGKIQKLEEIKLKPWYTR